jgi:hypothetical protein
LIGPLFRIAFGDLDLGGSAKQTISGDTPFLLRIEHQDEAEPCGSVSNKTTSKPLDAAMHAMCVAIRVLATPPFSLPTQIIIKPPKKLIMKILVQIK